MVIGNLNRKGVFWKKWKPPGEKGGGSSGVDDVVKKEPEVLPSDDDYAVRAKSIAIDSSMRQEILLEEEMEEKEEENEHDAVISKVDSVVGRTTSVFQEARESISAVEEESDSFAVYRADSVQGGPQMSIMVSDLDDVVRRTPSVIAEESITSEHSLSLADDRAHKTTSISMGAQDSIDGSTTLPLYIPEEDPSEAITQKPREVIGQMESSTTSGEVSYDAPAAPQMDVIPSAGNIGEDSFNNLETIPSARPGLAPSSSVAMTENAVREQSFIGPQDSYLERSDSRTSNQSGQAKVHKELSFMGGGISYNEQSMRERSFNRSLQQSGSGMGDFFDNSPSGMLQRVQTEVDVTEDATAKAHDASLLAQAVAVAPVLSAKKKSVAKIIVLIYSMYGHVKAMSDAIVEGINDIDGVDVSIYQVPETLDSSVLKKLPSMKQTELPVLALEQVDLLKEADGIILGIPTRFGTVPAQIKALLDACYMLWRENGLLGKLATVFVSSASMQGGQETTVISAIHDFAHYGMMYVPIGSSPQLFNSTQPMGGSAYGAGTFSAHDGMRMPSAEETAYARHQGAYFAAKVRQFVCA